MNYHNYITQFNEALNRDQLIQQIRALGDVHLINVTWAAIDTECLEHIKSGIQNGYTGTIEQSDGLSLQVGWTHRGGVTIIGNKGLAGYSFAFDGADGDRLLIPVEFEEHQTESEKEMNEFTKVELYLTDDEVASIRQGYVPIETENSLRDSLPPLINLEVGTEYGYESGHRYRIVKLGTTQVVLMRLGTSDDHFATNDVGSTLVESRQKVHDDLLNNRAVIIEELTVDVESIEVG